MQQSKTKSKLFPNDLMIEVFGTPNPDAKTKHRYFFNKWMEWKPNTAYISNDSSTDPVGSVREKLQDLGLREFWDYQIRLVEIRFASPEYLAMWRLSNDV